MNKKIIALLAIWMIFSTLALSQNKNNKSQSYTSEWIENATIELPQDLKIFSHRTSEGDTRYWFEIDGLKIYILPVNKEHYLNRTATILLVEWYNVNTDTYKYTTRKKDKQPRLSIFRNDE